MKNKIMGSSKIGIATSRRRLHVWPLWRIAGGVAFGVMVATIQPAPLDRRNRGTMCLDFGEPGPDIRRCRMVCPLVETASARVNVFFSVDLI